MPMSYERLSESQVAEALQDLTGWSLESGMLGKVFQFESYSRGVLFANAVAHIAEALNHHPDIHIGYGQVRVTTVTHDADGLTGYDVELATRVQRLV